MAINTWRVAISVEFTLFSPRKTCPVGNFSLSSASVTINPATKTRIARPDAHVPVRGDYSGHLQ